MTSLVIGDRSPHSADSGSPLSIGSVRHRFGQVVGQPEAIQKQASGASGSLNIAIGGTNLGTQFGQLAVTNGTNLNGTLNIKLINSFVPAIGNTFTILSTSARTGTFSTVNGLSINGSEHFEIAYNATNVTLTVVSGP